MKSFDEHKQAGRLANYEAEMALLAAILARNEIWYAASEAIRAEHFADALHGRIFDAIGRMVRDGKVANVVTLKTEFEADPALVDQGGGVRYLARLAGSVVTLRNATDYAEEIRDLWLRRELVAQAEALREAAGCSDTPV